MSYKLLNFNFPKQGLSSEQFVLLKKGARLLEHFWFYSFVRGMYLVVWLEVWKNDTISQYKGPRK